MGGARAKLGNQLASLLYKAAVFFVWLSVCTPPLFRHDRRTATKFGTHIRVDTGLILSFKKICPPHPRGVPWGCWGVFRGSKNQKSGKCHELPRKSLKKMLNPGVGWGGGFRGQHLKKNYFIFKNPVGGGVGWKF